MDYRCGLMRTSQVDDELHTRSPSPYEWVRNSSLGSTHHTRLLRQPVQNSVCINGAPTSLLAESLASNQEQSLTDMHSANVASFVASIQPAYVGRDNGAIQDERIAFVALLRACAKKKDLHRGTTIHGEISRKGLIKECSDALAIMYAKCGALAKAKALLDIHKSVNVFPWTALIVAYARKGCGQDAVHCFDDMELAGIQPDAVTYACILKACGAIEALDKGRQIHKQILRQSLLQNDIVLSGALVDMYVKCGDLSKALHVLEEFPSQDVISWSSILSGYTQQGQADQALYCFECMQQKGISPDAVTYTSILKACGDIGALDSGKQIHNEIIRYGLLKTHISLGNALVDMYAKCGELSKAQCVLKELPCRDVVSWNALITGLAQHGQGQLALNSYNCMKHEGIPPDKVTYLCVLKACGIIGAVEIGTSVHDEMTRKGLLQDDIVLGNALVDMYAKCGALAKARSVLEKLISRDVVSWNALITGYAQHGQGEQALECFELMQIEGISPNVVTYLCVTKACGLSGAFEKGKQIHNRIASEGLLQKHTVLGNALVDMYGNWGAVLKADCVLEALPSRDVVTWNTLIAGYVQEGQCEQALICFDCMQREGIPPDALTFTCILKACGLLGALDKGEETHDKIVKQGLLQNDLVLGNGLIDMYAKCGAPFKAHCVLEDLPSRDIVSWNALIAGYAQEGQGEQALDCLECMQSEGIAPNVLTLGYVIHVCSHLGLVDQAHEYFVHMTTKYGVKPNLPCFTCMIDLFGRAGHLDKAVELINATLFSDISAVWHALLGACQNWGDVNVGRWAFERAIQLDKSDGAAYVLMANIYASAGMQEDAAHVETMRMTNTARMESVNFSIPVTFLFAHA